MRGPRETPGKAKTYSPLRTSSIKLSSKYNATGRQPGSNTLARTQHRDDALEEKKRQQEVNAKKRAEIQAQRQREREQQQEERKRKRAVDVYVKRFWKELVQENRAKEVKRQLANAQSLQEVLLLDPVNFERKIADLLLHRGYHHVSRCGGAGDLGADITCLDADNRKIVVQCKRYAIDRRIGSPAVQSFIGMLYTHHKGHCGLFVTTGGFTEAARSLAAQHHINLVGGSELAKWLKA